MSVLKNRTFRHTFGDRVCAVGLSLVLAVALVPAASIAHVAKAYADGLGIRMMVVDAKPATHRQNRQFQKGALNDYEELELRVVGSSSTAEKITWSVENDNIVSVTPSHGGRTAIVRPWTTEGYTKLTVTAEVDGKKVEDDAYYMVYTKVEAAAGRVTVDGASLQRRANFDNKWVRGTAYTGQQLTVDGICAGAYRVLMPANFHFSDPDATPSTYCLIRKSQVSIPVQSVSVDVTDVELARGQRKRVEGSVKPTIADSTAVTWTSSDESVATVSNKGIITAKGEGAATITAASSIDAGKHATCSVKVEGEYVPEPFFLVDEAVSLSIDAAKTLKTSSAAIEWVSSNPSVAIVDGSGRVTAISPGSARVTAVSEGDKTDSCTVQVKSPRAPTVKTKKSGSKKVVLTWGYLEEADGYEVYQYKTKKKKYKKVKTLTLYDDERYKGDKATYKVRTYQKSRGRTYYSAFTKAKLGLKTTATYTIVFKKGDGSGKSYKQKKIDYNKSVALKANKFSRAGYAFVGWAASKGGQVIYKDGAEVTKLTKKKSVNLYAIWTRDTKRHYRTLLLGDTKTEGTGEIVAEELAALRKVLAKSSLNRQAADVTVYPDKDPSQIEAKMKEIGRPTIADDVTIVYIHCHGADDGSLLLGSSVSPMQLRKWLDNYVAGKVVLFIAACYSGVASKNVVDNAARSKYQLGAAANRSFIDNFLRVDAGKTNRFKILTTTGVEVGYTIIPQYAWLPALGYDAEAESATGPLEADTMERGNGDGVVSFYELYAYSYPRVDEFSDHLCLEQLYMGGEDIAIYAR